MMVARKKLGLAAAMALTVLAFSAPGAMANASFPHGDTNPTHWTGVDVSNVNGCTPGDRTATPPGAPCTFKAVSAKSVLNGIITCKVVLTVNIWKDGYTEITNAAITAGGGSILCPAISPQNLPWTDQLCEYTQTSPHEYWDRIDVDFSVPLLGSITGELFGSLGTGAPFTNIKVDSDIGASSNHLLANGATSASTPYQFRNTADTANITITGTSDDTAACTWPELS